MLIDFTTLRANPNDYPSALWVAGEEGNPISKRVHLTVDVNVSDLEE